MKIYSKKQIEAIAVIISSLRNENRELKARNKMLENDIRFLTKDNSQSDVDFPNSSVRKEAKPEAETAVNISDILNL